MRTYGTLERKGSSWLMSGVPPHVAIKLKAIFKEIPKEQVGEFAFPYTEEVCEDLEWFLHRYPMQMSDADREDMLAGKKLFAIERAESERILFPDWTPPPRTGFKDHFKLRKHQAQAGALARKRGCLMIADPVGGGKTYSVLDALMDSLPMAIVANSHLPIQFDKEYITPNTHLRAHVIKGTKPYNLPPADVYLFAYSNIAGWVDVAAQNVFKGFGADEVQELRHGTATAKGRAAKVFAERARVRVCSSGTPFFNMGDEIFNIFEIFEPGLLGDRSEFYREWCVSLGDGKWAVSDPQALGSYLRDQQAYIRREEIGLPINRQIVVVDYDESAEQKTADLARRLAIKALSSSFIEAGQAARELDLLLRKATGVGKARGVAAIARMYLEEGIPIIIFAWHREVYAILLKELADFNPLMVTGSESSKKKDENKRAFLCGESNVVLMSLRSGVGIDGYQHRCNTVLFAEYDWTRAVHDQCIGRVRREGQKAKAVEAVYCHADEGSDPSMIALHGVKGSQFRGIMDPFSGPEIIPPDSGRLKQLAIDYLARHGGLQ